MGAKGSRANKCKVCGCRATELMVGRRLCKPCYSASKIGARRAEALKNRYGITVEFYNELLEKQNKACAICTLPETRRHQNGKVKNLSVDHCHSTGKVRGLLCYSCNTSVGFMKENFIAITNLALYVAEHKGI